MNDESIIDYILRTQEYFRYRKFNKKKRKWKAENVDLYVMYCKYCDQLWEKVEYRFSKKRYIKYEKSIIPIIGKKQKRCPDCKKKKQI